MANHSESVDFPCDSPPYTVVKACQQLGFHAPLDVRWCRLSGVFQSLPERSGILHFQPWKSLLGRSYPREKVCLCGGPLPILERYLFAFQSGRRANYLLGQCPQCRTIFWEEGSATSSNR
jgi:hypothetical protein